MAETVQHQHMTPAHITSGRRIGQRDFGHQFSGGFVSATVMLNIPLVITDIEAVEGKFENTHIITAQRASSGVEVLIRTGAWLVCGKLLSCKKDGVLPIDATIVSVGDTFDLADAPDAF